jgi:ATP-dependent DNA helicase RecQ
MRDPARILHDVFGFTSFRPLQDEIVAAVMRGEDRLAIMPTGAGKSICYQVPAIARDGTGLVISPLVALMEDQVRALEANGVAAGAITAATPDAERRRLLNAVDAGTLDLLYVAPERVALNGFADRLARARLSLIAIDEAHCVSEWGHDFRPDYRRLKAFCDRFPGVPRIAMTATANKLTRADILTQLGIDPAGLVVAGFDRPNIRYAISARDNGRRQLMTFLDRHRGQSGIVYAPTRDRVDSIAATLQAAGINALPYHAGLDPGVRSANSRAFTRAEDMAMVATIAFGMGIDKPDVRYVVHLGLPKSIEAYYQETGRAGRDGDAAVAQMFYDASDIARARQFIDAGSAEDRLRADHARLNALIGLCETTGCRRIPLLTYFGEPAPEPCCNCDNCLTPPTVVDATETAQKLLSAIYRTGQRFGLGHVCDVLAGSVNARVLQLGHDRLSVFGIGDGVDTKSWRSVQRQLVAIDAVRVDEHGGMLLGPAARGVLRGETRIAIRKAKPRERRRSRDSVGPDDPLFLALRQVRRRLAEAAGVPAYVIFHDSTLRAMAAMRPRDHAELAEVPGVGTAKLDRYGTAFLDTIANA